MAVRLIGALCLLSFAASLAAQDAVECALFPPAGMLRAESSNEDLGRFRLACTGTTAAWPFGTSITLRLQFSTPLHRASRPRLRTHGMPTGVQWRSGVVSGAVVTWSDVPFPRARADTQPAFTMIEGLAVNATLSPPEVTVFASVASERATVSVLTPLVTVSRVVPGLRARVMKAAEIRACAPDEPRTATVEISEGFLSAFGSNDIMLSSDRGTMEGPPRVAVGGLEFQRLDRFTFPQSGRLMYSVQGASGLLLESVPLPLTVTGDEGEAGENIQVDLAYVPRDGTDRQFVKSATFVVASFESCRATGTTLSFPFVSNRSGFSTSIVISNTTPQDGSCELRWNGADGHSLAVPARNQAVLRLEELVSDFQGYLLASCDFDKPLGYAYITDFEGQTQTYLAKTDPN